MTIQLRQHCFHCGKPGDHIYEKPQLMTIEEAKKHLDYEGFDGFNARLGLTDKEISGNGCSIRI